MKHLSRTFISLFVAMTFVAPRLDAQALFEPDVEILKVGEVAFQTPKKVVLGFRNKGNEPLQLVKVIPSCDCVDVKYPQQAVPAGGRGEITLVYDASTLGTFYKDIEIYTNSSDKPLYMAIQGTVVTDVVNYESDYPINLGNVCLQSNYVEFDDVNRGDKPHVEIGIANLEHTAYRPVLMHLPPYLKAESIPTDIPPGKTGKVRLTLDSEKLHQLGLNQTSIYLARYVGDKVGESNEIFVNAVLLPDFSHLTETARKTAPKLQIDEDNIDFGDMGSKEKVSRTVVLRNVGQTPLHFKQVQVFNKALSVSLGNRVLKPGKSTKLKITVIGKYLKKAKSRPRVLLITDDPEHSKEVININVRS